MGNTSSNLGYHFSMNWACLMMIWSPSSKNYTSTTYYYIDGPLIMRFSKLAILIFNFRCIIFRKFDFFLPRIMWCLKRRVEKHPLSLCTRSGAIAMNLYILTDAAWKTWFLVRNGTVERAAGAPTIACGQVCWWNMIRGPIWHNFLLTRMAV